MAGANYMGGKRNAAKARLRDVTGRVQRGFFGRQRLEMLSKGLSASSWTTKAPTATHRARNGLPTLVKEISLAHAKNPLLAISNETGRGEDENQCHRPLSRSTPCNTPSPTETASSDNGRCRSTALVSPGAHSTRKSPAQNVQSSPISSTSVRSSLSNSKHLHSKLLAAVDTSEPALLRSTLNKILAFPDLAGLSCFAEPSRREQHRPPAKRPLSMCGSSDATPDEVYYSSPCMRNTKRFKIDNRTEKAVITSRKNSLVPATSSPYPQASGGRGRQARRMCGPLSGNLNPVASVVPVPQKDPRSAKTARVATRDIHHVSPTTGGKDEYIVARALQSPSPADWKADWFDPISDWGDSEVGGALLSSHDLGAIVSDWDTDSFDCDEKQDRRSDTDASESHVGELGSPVQSEASSTQKSEHAFQVNHSILGSVLRQPLFLSSPVPVPTTECIEVHQMSKNSRQEPDSDGQEEFLNIFKTEDPWNEIGRILGYNSYVRTPSESATQRHEDEIVIAATGRRHYSGSPSKRVLDPILRVGTGSATATTDQFSRLEPPGPPYSPNATTREGLIKCYQEAPHTHTPTVSASAGESLSPFMDSQRQESVNNGATKSELELTAAPTANMGISGLGPGEQQQKLIDQGELDWLNLIGAPPPRGQAGQGQEVIDGVYGPTLFLDFGDENEEEED